MKFLHLYAVQKMNEKNRCACYRWHLQWLTSLAMQKSILHELPFKIKLFVCIFYCWVRVDENMRWHGS